MQNILHIVQSFDISGRSKTIYDLSDALSKKGFYSSIVSLTNNCKFLDSKNGMECLCLNKKEGLDLSVVFKLIRIIRDRKISLLHTHGRGALIYGIIIKKLGGIKRLVHTVHRADGDTLTMNWLMKMILTSSVDKAVGVSNSARLKFIEKHMFPVIKTTTIYNGIDISLYGQFLKSILPVSELADIRSRSNLLIGMVGNFSYDKDQKTLILAFSKVLKIYPTAQLIMVGDGPKANEMKKLCQNLSIVDNVAFLGFRNDIPAILSFLDIFVLSSHTEGLPISILEAMAVGVPVIGTNLDGIKEIIQDGVSGKLFKCSNPLDLKETIISVWENKELCNSFKKNAYYRVKNDFSINKMYENYKKLYQEISR